MIRRFFASSSAFVISELRNSAEASNLPIDVTEDDNMKALLDDEQLERVFESIDEAEDSDRLQSVKRETGLL